MYIIHINPSLSLFKFVHRTWNDVRSNFALCDCLSKSNGIQYWFSFFSHYFPFLLWGSIRGITCNKTESSKRVTDYSRVINALHYVIITDFLVGIVVQSYNRRLYDCTMIVRLYNDCTTTLTRKSVMIA